MPHQCLSHCHRMHRGHEGVEHIGESSGSIGNGRAPLSRVGHCPKGTTANTPSSSGMGKAMGWETVRVQVRHVHGGSDTLRPLKR